MARRSVKIGSTGGMGQRYGVTIRRRIRDIEKGLRGWHTCPKCKAKTVRRRSTGIWVCRRCGAKIASSAYTIAPPKAVRKALAEVLEEEKITAEEVVEFTSGELPEEEKR